MQDVTPDYPCREVDLKEILGIYDPPPRHWVGDGFPVRSLFT